MALPPEEGGRDTTGQGLAPGKVAVGGTWVHRILDVIGGERGGVPTAGEVRRGVVPTLFASRAPLAHSAPADVNDARVAGANVLDVDAHLLAGGRQKAGEEDIRGLGQLIENFEPALGSKIDADAPLAPVGLFDHEIHGTGATSEHSRRHQAHVGGRPSQGARP